MVSSTRRFKQHNQAVRTELDGEVVIFQSNTCDYLVLNETGSAIWDLLKSKPSLPDICKHLQDEYEVAPDECKTSVETWLEAALDKKVIAMIDD